MVERKETALCKYKRNHMSEMHTVATWTTPSIQEERFALLIAVKDFVKFTLSCISTSVGQR